MQSRAAATPRPDEPEAPAGGYYMGGGSGGMMMGRYAGAPAGAEEAQYFSLTEDTNAPPRSYGYSYGGSSSAYRARPRKPDESEEEAPESSD